MSLPRLHTAGRQILREDGSVFPWRQASAFRAHYSFQAGEGVPVHFFRYLRDELDITILRVFGSKHAWPGYPNQWRLWPGGAVYMQVVDDVLTQAGLFGLYVEYCALCDAQELIPDVGAQRGFIDELAERLAGHTNGLLSLGNEYRKNGFDPTNFARSYPGILYSRGSNLSDAPPPGPPFGDYVEYHSKRGPDWWGRASDALFLEPWSGFPPDPGIFAVNGEPMGAAEAPRPGSRDNVPEHHRVYHAQSAVAGIGSCLHGDALMRCAVPSGIERACYLAASEGQHASCS